MINSSTKAPNDAKPVLSDVFLHQKIEKLIPFISEEFITYPLWEEGKYIPFLKDELVLVCNSNNPFVRQNEISVNDLKSMKFITRERGSGTLEVIEYALKKAGLKFSDLQIEMQLGSTESIKSYLLNSDCFAFMSIHAVSKELKNKELTVLDVERLSVERYFYIITLLGKSDSLSELFIQNMSNHYNLKL